MNERKYDIAISLCKQDVEFARKLVKALNPSLRIFFYEDRQEELISKSGPEAFAKVFKEEARIIIILSRKEWSETFYTDIERNAIIDRTSVKNQGYSFLIVLPMEPGEAPSWYPSTKIYANPTKFTVELLAKFIEFKVTEEGGVVKPLTSEEYSAYFVNQLKEKREIISLQSSLEAIEMLKSEVDKFKSFFNSKSEYFSKNNYHFSFGRQSFNYCINDAHFGLDPYLLNCEIQNMEWGTHIVTTQQASLLITLFKLKDSMRYDILNSQQYKFYYSGKLNGWSIPETYTGSNNIHLTHLFTEYGNNWYDLKNPIASEKLVDDWFMKLWQILRENYKEII